MLTKLWESFIKSELVKSTFDNWGNIDSLISIIICVSTIIPFFVKRYKSYKSKSELQVYISKNDLDNLKYYIPIYGQNEDPCENEEIKNAIAKDRIKLIPYFMEIIKKDLYGRYFIILADSGMGKSTFLRKFYIKYRRKIFSKQKIMYYSLSNWKDLEEIKSVSNKYKKILLLDSLDEDQYAIENYDKRMDEIIKTTQDFFKVITTCRTQFFPNRDREPKETNLINSESGKKSNRFRRIYLSPFSDKEVNAYLFKKFRLNIFKRKSAKEIIEKCPDLMARPMLLGFIDILVDTKKEEYKKIQRDIVGIYEIIVNEWIEREENDLIPRERLEKFTNDVVMYMYKHDKLDVTQEEIEELCTQREIELLNPIFAKSKSLLNRYGNGIYKFSHKSIYEFLLTKYLFEEKNIHSDFFLKVITKEINNIYYVSFRRSKNGRNVGNANLQASMLMENMNLSNMDLSNVNINILVEKGVFENVILKDISFKKANLTSSDLKNVIMLFKANLQGANLQFANLQGANLLRANLYETILSGANLHKAILIGVDLMNADLMSTNLIRANLQGADLQGANLRGADLQNADLQGVYLQGANLQGANLQGANLANTVFDIYNILFIIGGSNVNLECSKIWISKNESNHKIQIYNIHNGRVITYNEFINSSYYKSLVDDKLTNPRDSQ